MHACGKLIGERGVDGPVCFQPAPPAKRLRDDPYTEVGFPFRARANVTLVQMRLVYHFQAPRLKGVC